MSNDQNNMSVIQAYTMNFSKSSRNFILRVLLFLFMVLAGESVMGQTVIYPNGGNCANPGEYVTIKFDRNITEYEFNLVRLSSCSNSTYLCRWVLFVPIFCAPSECPKGNIIEPERLSDSEIRIQVPLTINSDSYDIYYGQRTSSSFRFLIEWQTYRYTPVGEVRINVCTTNPVIRTSECFCPGSEYSFDVENYFGENASNFELSYVKSNNKSSKISVNSSNFDSNTGKGTFTFTCPNDVSESFTITLTSGSKTAQATINKCQAEIKYVPDCAVNNQEIHYTIANACPSSTYTIDGKSFNGSTSYNVSSTYKPSNNSQTFQLKENNTEIATFDVPQCNITVTFSQWISSDFTPTSGCYLTLNQLNIGNNISVVATGGSGDPPTLYYQYSEVIDGQQTEFKDVLSDTKFEVGKTYKLRIMIYVDNAYIRYEDTNAFTITPYQVKGYTYYGGNVSVTKEEVNKNNQTVDCGSSVVFTAIPDPCMKFTGWSDGNKENPRTVVVDRNWNLEAKFEQIKPTVIAVSNDNNFGTVSIKNQWNGDFTSGNQVNNCGDRLTITATPKNSCYELEKWSDETTDLVKTIDVRTDVNLTAIFRQKDVHITASSNDESLGTVAISGTNSCGNTVTITATPKACSDFVQWNDGNTNKERTVEVTENQNFVATFTKASNFTLTCKDYSFLREDAGSGNATVTFPLPEVSAGAVDSYSWSVSNGLNVSSSIVTGTLPFGEQSVTITATKCGHSESCTTTVKLLKSVPPCEK